MFLDLVDYIKDRDYCRSIKAAIILDNWWAYRKTFIEASLNLIDKEVL